MNTTIAFLILLGSVGVSAKDAAKVADNPAANAVKTPGQPAETAPQPPSGTKPAEPASPGQGPAEPAEPAKPGEKAAKPDSPGEKPEAGQEKIAKDSSAGDEHGKKDAAPGKKDRPAGGKKSGKSGVSGRSLPSLPSALPPRGAAAGAGTDKEKTPAPAAPKETSTASVTASTGAATAEPLFSQGKGPKIAVMLLDGEGGAEFAALLSSALKPDLQVYSHAAMAAKEYDVNAINRISARKIAAELGVDFIVTGKMGKRTATLTIISIYLRDAGSGDVKLTDSRSLRAGDRPETLSALLAGKIKEKAAELGR